jgi:benzoyl-CoA reductase/2-hydroxyglutaryl-CoA dehydratase subunit BcrC/BadD/HgdB
MTSIAYSSPMVPPEWIAAHGLHPRWLRAQSNSGRPLAVAGRGVCPYAGALIEEVLSGIEAAAVVLTTTCDQMRYAAAYLEHEGPLPVFLMNVPSTWQPAASGRLYLDELRRLGRFLVRLGGEEPSPEKLTEAMLSYDSARAKVREARPRLSARGVAEAMIDVREGAAAQGWLAAERSDAPADINAGAPLRYAPATRREANGGVPLALVGGPLAEKDFDVLDLVEQAGGRVVLDATEGGERTLPAPFDPHRLQADPLGELAAAYFGAIPDVFRRPNDPLYEWLGREVAARGVRGLVFRRYLWCDLWHAELERLRQWSPAPVLDLDAADDERGAGNRTLGRLEAFVETLR